MPFRARYKFGGGVPTLHGPYVVKSGETITQGMISKLTSGEVEPADSGDTLSGWAESDAAAGEEVNLYEVDTAVSVVDASARVRGAALDIDTGSQSVTTDSNSDVVNVESTAATAESMLMIHPQSTDLYGA